MSQSTVATRPFLERANDIRCRERSVRLSRFLRARLRRIAAAAILIADDPRVIRAWRKGWDAQHFVGLRRWRDEGFRPKVAYDIGAHHGAWSEMAQEIFDPAVCVLFEPQAECRRRIAERVGSPFAKGQWQVLPVGLGDVEQSSTIHITANPAASSLLKPLNADVPESWGAHAVGQETVQVSVLDRLVPQQLLPLPDLVKIDVQGYEGLVLAGGRETLSRASRIVIEVSLEPIYAGQALLPEVLATVCGWGFRVEDIQETSRQWPGRLWQVDLWLRRD
jgi:FkbM family methyltransferase